MPAYFDQIPARRLIADRRALAEALATLPGSGTALRQSATSVLRPALEAGRAEIARRIGETPSAGNVAAAAQAFLTDQLLRVAFDFTTHRLQTLSNPTTAERLTLAAVGG